MSQASATRQVEGMLSALERQGQTVLKAAKWAEQRATPLSFEAFRDFLDKVRSYQTLSSLLDTRIENVPGTKKKRLRHKFDELNRLVYRTSLTTLAQYFMLFVDNRNFPIGQRGVFERALSLLQTIRDAMSEELADRVLDADFPVTLDELEGLIDEAIQATPELVDFSDEPQAMPPSAR